MTSCAEEGGCPSDYIAISISAICMILLLSRLISPFVVHKVPRSKGSGFWIPVIQVFASCNLLLSIVLSVNFLDFKKKYWWQSCYVWAVIHIRKPLNNRCHMGTWWIIPVVCLHTLYVATLVGFTAAIRHIEFRFDELRDLWRGILVSASTIGVWTAAYILNEVHDDVSWLQAASRFLLLVTASILILALFSLSSSQPLLSQISLRRREPLEYETMGQALGIPDSGLLLQREKASVIDPSEPLDKLLLNKRFRHSFMAFADSCLAGENVHFYDEVHELSKIPVEDTVKRIYMARHIIEKYISAGATTEVNISHRSRQEILTTSNLACPDLFNNALNELIQLMKTNLVRDYWSSTFYLKFKEESSMRSNSHELEQMRGWNYSPRLSSVHGIDDPFHQEHFPKGSGCN
ncbi:hypothetical protein FEM48_Zijuj10G0044900 [Ziziphus jujuba var. spinosa]|uniref:RGS domain-containing protein n=1 Tax=Ziziphus jujuba var. spinosa TaxID=714518 RepID=A0A978ULA9_ZIZJJ|nr:hypothetical protein FEM48_Zijuj10G0044900 [Ziziphus jujuba var. spinosa]